MHMDARWHKIVLDKRQQHATTSARAAAATTTARRATVTPVQDDAASIERSGIANTATGKDKTRVAPTAPPTRHRTQASATYSYTFATLNTQYNPGSNNVMAATANGDSGTTTAAAAGVTDQADASSSSNASSNTGLSKTAMIAIIAGAAAGAVLLFAVVCCCCWRKRKQKKKAGRGLPANGQWQKLNASGPSVHSPDASTSVPMKQFGHAADESTWSVDNDKSYGAYDGAYGGYDDADARRHDGLAYGSQQQRQNTMLPKQQQPHRDGQLQQYNWQLREQQDLAAARAELFGHQERVQSINSRQGEVISFSGRGGPQDSSPGLPRSAPNQAFTAYGEPSSHSLASMASSNQYADAQSELPRAPSAGQLPSFSKRDTQHATDLAVDRFRDVLMGAVGRPESDGSGGVVSSPSEGRSLTNMVYTIGEDEEDRFTDAGTGSANTRPQRSSSKREASRSSAEPVDTGTSRPAQAAIAGSYPPQARSAFANQAIRREPAATYSTRVDSKPLRELEDILDSFHQHPGQGRGVGSVRSNSVRSATTINSMAPPGAARSGHAPAMSNSSLSMYLNQLHSASMPPTPPAVERSSPFEDAEAIAGVATGHPSRSPLAQQQQLLAPGIRAGELDGSLSIDNDRDRLGDVYEQMQLERSPTSGSTSSSAVPSLSHSPLATPTTPQDLSATAHMFGLGESSPNRQGQSAGNGSNASQKNATKVPVLVVDSADGVPSGFGPLSSHGMDSSYRSATMSVYGMYDDDDVPELKGLPMKDPRVSKHLSQLYGGQTGYASVTVR